MTENLLRHREIMTGRELLAREEASGPMPPGLAELWRFLSRHCRGRGNVMLAAEIAVRLGILTRDREGRAVGDGKKIVHMASALVRDHLKPVASACTGDRRGLFVAVTREEKDIEARSLEGRGLALLARAKAFRQSPIHPPIPVQEKLWEERHE